MQGFVEIPIDGAKATTDIVVPDYGVMMIVRPLAWMWPKRKSVVVLLLAILVTAVTFGSALLIFLPLYFACKIAASVKPAFERGYVVSPERGTIEFPGWGIQMDDGYAFLKAHYWQLWAKRFSAKLSDVMSISADTSTTTTHTYEKGSGWRSTTNSSHSITITLTHGAVVFPFSDSARRDQFYQAIRMINGMGQAVVLA